MLVSCKNDLKKVPKVDENVVEKCKKEQRSRSRDSDRPTHPINSGMVTRARTGKPEVK